MEPLLVVVTTVESLDDARRLARGMVESGLAACAQIEPIESWYHWQGALCQATEQRIRFKTRAACYAALERALREQHPYELPAIHAVAVAQADPAYAAWVGENTRGGG